MTYQLDNTVQSSPLLMNRRLINFLLVAAAYWSPVATAFAPPSAAGVLVSHRTAVRSQQPLFVVADHREGETLNHNNNNNGDDDDDSWVKTSDGGFLPKISNVLKERIGRKSLPEEVLTIQEYKAVVADEKDRMVVVRFYAPWCKACKAIEQPFRKLCRDNPEIKFVEVPLTKENAYLHDGLGVPSLPFGHIYHPEAGLVEELKIKKKEFSIFLSVLDTYIQGECAVEYDEDGGVCRQGPKQKPPSLHRP